MFGLTKREQRWKAEQKAAETIAGVLVAAVNAKSHMGVEMNKSEQLIACLEGEIAKRDARIVELGKYKRFESLYAEAEREVVQLRAELAALKAQEPVAWISKDGTYAEASTNSTVYGSHTLPLYAAPLSEAKAQGVVMPERWNVPRPMWKDARQPYGNPLNHADIEAAEKFNLALDEVARLNAAPVQQVSVPDGLLSVVKRLLSAETRKCRELARAEYRIEADTDYRQAMVDLRAMLNATQAAPAADGWIPVSERLPAVESRLDQECRAGTLSIAPLNVSAAVLVFDGEKVRSTRLEWFDGCLPLPYCITHWMPLPAAPAAHRAQGVV